MPLARPTPPSPTPAGRLPALDGVRGLAILLVILFHTLLASPHNLWHRALLAPAIHGWHGVKLFFVLSGFLITGILVDAKNSDYYFRNFYLRRTLRIFPLYYAVLLVTLVLLPLLGRQPQLGWSSLWFWSYLSNYYIAGHRLIHPILDPTWSLAVEEQFYLLWPLVVWFLNRRGLLRLCVGMIAGAWALRLTLLTAGYSGYLVQAITPSYFDALGLGALLSLLARDAKGLAPLARWALPAGLICGIAGLGLTGIRTIPLARSSGLTLVVLACGAVIVLAVGAPHSFVSRLLSSAILRFLGRYSYALYLFHHPIQKLLGQHLLGPTQLPIMWHWPLLGQALFSAAAIAVALVPAVLSWHLFEAPILKLKRLFPSGSVRVTPGDEPGLSLATTDVSRSSSPSRQPAASTASTQRRCAIET